MEQHSGELFRGVFDAAPDAVVIVDAAGVIAVANSKCREVFGYAPDELVGRPVEMLVPVRFRADHPARRAGYGNAADARPMGLLRLAATRRDGSEFPAEISLAPIESDGARYVSATVRDISPRIREEERFRSLLEAAPDPTVIVDAEGVIGLVNDRMCAVYGYSRQELIGRRADVLVAEAGRTAARAAFEAFVTAPSELPMGGIRQLATERRDGLVIPVEVALSPLLTEDGLLISIALRDVSERVQLLADSQRVRDDLIATVSHELRTPLTSIIGYTELLTDLDETDLSRRARKLIDVIERNALRELHLVDDLLTMAYLDDHRLRIAREPLDLAEVCRHVVDDQALRARQRGLSMSFVGGEAAAVVGDFPRLVQVVENLVTNALKFTRPGGRVDVALANDGRFGIVEVRDNGIGVSPEEKLRLFERLYRSPAAIAAQVQGAGLGLSIVHAIVEGHGGWVDLQSELDVGTVVRVALPHAERAHAGPTAP